MLEYHDLEFVEYLNYASDRMNLNRWIYLQLCIGKAADLVYSRYCKLYEGCHAPLDTLSI